MALHPAVQVMKLAASRPFIGYRPAYFLDHRFRGRDGRPLWWVDPAGPSFPLAPPLRFTKPGIDLGAILAQHLKVG